MPDPTPPATPPRPPPLTLRYANRAQQEVVKLETWPGGLRITLPKRVLRFLAPTVITLDAQTLRLKNVPYATGDTRHGSVDVDRPRAAVYEMKYVGHSGNLFIKAHGYEFVDCRPHRDSKVVEWVAQQLNDALGLGGPVSGEGPA